MILHIGEENVVFMNDIIAIFDIEKTTISNNTREYLKACEEKGMIKTVGKDIPKSFIVTMRNGKQKVYLSPISSSTLNKRVLKETEDIRRNPVHDRK
ncbi:MAG: extracellular matrix regulator RemB [Acetivibrionales bacterium]